MVQSYGTAFIKHFCFSQQKTTEQTGKQYQKLLHIFSLKSEKGSGEMVFHPIPHNPNQSIKKYELVHCFIFQGNREVDKSHLLFTLTIFKLKIHSGCRIQIPSIESKLV